MNTVLFNDGANTYYLCMTKMCERMTYSCEHAEVMMTRSHSKQLLMDIYNSYASKVIDLAKSQVKNGILNIAHQWAVANIRPRKALTVTENKMFYSDLERWRVSDRIYISEFTKRSMVYDYTKYRDR